MRIMLNLNVSNPKCKKNKHNESKQKLRVTK